MILQKELAALNKALLQSKTVVQNMEKGYLKSSEFLERIVESSMTMNADSQAIIQMVTWNDRSEGNFDGLFETLTTYLQKTDVLSGRLKSRAMDVFLTAGNIDSFIRWEQQLMQTLEPLRTMRTFFLIEVAKLKTTNQRAIRSVVDDIQRLYREAQAVSTRELESMNRLSSQLHSDKSMIERDLDLLMQTIRIENQRLDQSLRGLLEDLDNNKSIDVQLCRTTGEVTRLVSEAVTIIQNEDITGQKLDHVMTAMELIVDKIREWQATGCNIEQSELPQYLVSASRIQQQQILGIIRDYQVSHDAISGICPLMIDQIRKLDHDCLSLREFNTLTTSADGAIQILLEAVASISGLMDRMKAVATHTRELLEPLRNVSAEMADAIENITRDLRVVTINARIMASRQGARSGLGALTENVSQISIASQKLSGDLKLKLQSFIEEVNASIVSFSGMRDEVNTLLGEYQEFQKEGNASLHGFRDKALTRILDLTRHAEEIESAVDQCHGRQEVPFDSAFFTSIFDLLGTIIEQVMAHCGNAVDFDSFDVNGIDDLSKNYTMHSERETQAIVTGQKAILVGSGSSGDDDGFILF
jgi:hypothetical protein